MFGEYFRGFNIKYIAISDIKKVNVIIKNGERVIIIDNKASKFITDIMIVVKVCG